MKSKARLKIEHTENGVFYTPQVKINTAFWFYDWFNIIKRTTSNGYYISKSNSNSYADKTKALEILTSYQLTEQYKNSLKIGEITYEYYEKEININ